MYSPQLRRLIPGAERQRRWRARQVRKREHHAPPLSCMELGVGDGLCVSTECDQWTHASSSTHDCHHTLNPEQNTAEISLF